MSASLVGSEMCIRDSGGASHTCSRQHCQRWRLAPGATRPRGAAARTRPVSYTHLTLPTICSV
eukprot:8556046-Alexandrium_andersonii.AAC.1